MGRIGSVRDLEVYRKGFDAAMKIFEITKRFPAEERYSVTEIASSAPSAPPRNDARGTGLSSGSEPSPIFFVIARRPKADEAIPSGLGEIASSGFQPSSQ